MTWLRCWWFGHDPVKRIREKPRREVTVCGRCGELLVEDPWDDGGSGPRRMA